VSARAPSFSVLILSSSAVNTHRPPAIVSLAMAVSNGDQASADAGEIGLPPPNIKVPSPEVRRNVAKTVDFIIRRTDRNDYDLRERARNNPKTTISFVLPEDPYHPYFLWYLEQVNQGKGPAAASRQTVQQSKPQGPPEPPKFRFSARMPNINAKDLEILKLTALYTARVGENWLKDLRNREAGNFQFEFLRANHSFFPFFRSLVEQYKILLEEEQTVEARIEELQRNIKNRFHILDRAKSRAEYVKYVTQQKQKEEKKAQDEQKEFQSIDWHDFAVIATVVIDEEDEAAELPPPTNLADLQSASLEQKAMVSLSSKRLEEAMPDEMMYNNGSYQPTMPPPGYPAMPHMAPAAQPGFAPLPPAPVDYHTAAQKREEEEARLRQAERDRAAQAQAAARGAPDSMRIRTDYVPRGKKANVAMVQCPNCKQNFPSDEIAEHIRSKFTIPN
jgi:splicing factor 3A subunit 1